MVDKMGKIDSFSSRFPKSSLGKTRFPVSFPGTFCPCFLGRNVLCRENELPRSHSGTFFFPYT